MMRPLLALLAATMPVAMATGAESADFAVRILARHNAERAVVGMVALKWDEKLAQGAAVWARHLANTRTFEHSPDDPRADPQGENLWFLPDEVGSDLPVTMWYFENSFGVVCKVPPRSSSHEGLCLFSPEEIY